MTAIKQFIDQWKDHGYEKGEAQTFWLSLLRDVFDIERAEEWIVFEQQINGNFIDARIPSTNVLIEQKSINRDLGSAFAQAKSYDNILPFEQKSHWIVCSDFQSFRVHDMNRPSDPPEIIRLEDLADEYWRLNFLIDREAARIKRELKISIEAGKIVGELYTAFRKSYVNPDAPDTRDSLNKLCTRLVFCLYAEDAGLFPKHAFHDWLNDFKTPHMRAALIKLFSILDTPEPNRDPYLEPALQKFKYVDGKLFADAAIEIPNFNEDSRYHLLTEAANFNWKPISPTIFGAMFENTLNPTTRKLGGMHYTSVENIHKLIDPLFMTKLRAELDQCGDEPELLLAFQNKIAGLKFFDPACGSGNFLTETFLSLRRLENEIISRIPETPVKVSIENFFGIEINDFAVAVARTALWIAEN